MVAITETHLDASIKLELQGYVIFRNDRNRDGGGVLIGIKEALKGITVETNRSKEGYESLWISIDNTRARIKFGVVYQIRSNANPSLRRIWH